MHWWRRTLIGVLVLYGLGLLWGYFRLPLAALKSLADYRGIAAAPAVSFGILDMEPAQEAYLRHAFRESPVPVVPSVQVSVEWNALVLARVSSSYYVSGTGAEWRDSLYLCVFGAWVRVYDFRHSMAGRGPSGGLGAAHPARSQTAASGVSGLQADSVSAAAEPCRFQGFPDSCRKVNLNQQGWRRACNRSRVR